MLYLPVVAKLLGSRKAAYAHTFGFRPTALEPTGVGTNTVE